MNVSAGIQKMLSTNVEDRRILIFNEIFIVFLKRIEGYEWNIFWDRISLEYFLICIWDDILISDIRMERPI